MPRKQLDILKDLFIAHRDGNEQRYQEIAQEYLRYLRLKGFHKKASEFKAILNSSEQPEKIQKSQKPAEPTLPLFDGYKEKSRKETSVKKNEYTWQVANGAEINFLQAQRLLAILISESKSAYSTKKVADILGYAEKKAGGFSRLLHFLGLLEDKTKAPTELATTILQVDPYLEDLGTLWFLHYHISSQPVLIIWNRIANRLMTRSKFTLQDAWEVLEDQRSYHSEYAFKHHLRKEFRVITRAYLESGFKKLNLLFSEDHEVYMRTIATSLPDDILLAAILFYKQRFYANEVTLEIKTLMQQENSPGRLFYLNEHKFREALERLRQNV